MHAGRLFILLAVLAGCGDGATGSNAPYVGRYDLVAVVDTLGQAHTLPTTYVPRFTPGDSSRWRAATVELRANATWRWTADASSFGAAAVPAVDSGSYTREGESTTSGRTRYVLQLRRAGTGAAVDAVVVARDTLYWAELVFTRR